MIFRAGSCSGFILRPSGSFEVVMDDKERDPDELTAAPVDGPPGVRRHGSAVRWDDRRRRPGERRIARDRRAIEDRRKSERRLRVADRRASDESFPPPDRRRGGNRRKSQDRRFQERRGEDRRKLPDRRKQGENPGPDGDPGDSL
ncbi:MAG: hypothetical protein LBH51_00545 [Treponema sp.]|nr:hypothetical protein [Treponema sp.]